MLNLTLLDKRFWTTKEVEWLSKHLNELLGTTAGREKAHKLLSSFKKSVDSDDYVRASMAFNTIAGAIGEERTINLIQDSKHMQPNLYQAFVRFGQKIQEKDLQKRINDTQRKMVGNLATYCPEAYINPEKEVSSLAKAAAVCSVFVLWAAATMGCINKDDDDSDGHSSDDLVSRINGPFATNLTGDQTLIGAIYMDGDFHHVFNDDSSIQTYNNATGDFDTLHSTTGSLGHIDLYGDKLALSENRPVNAGLSHRYEVSHIDVETGDRTVIDSTEIVGGSSADDPYKLVASATDGAFYLRANGNEWDFVYRDLDQNEQIVDSGLTLDEVISADSDGTSLVGFVDQSEHIRIYTRDSNGDYELKAEGVGKYITFSGDKVGVIDDDGLMFSAYDNLTGFEPVPDTDGALEVNIFGEYKLLTKDNAMFLLDEQNKPYEIWNQGVSDIWLDGLGDLLLRACGTFDMPNTGYDSGHLDVTIKA